MAERYPVGKDKEMQKWENLMNLLADSFESLPADEVLDEEAGMTADAEVETGPGAASPAPPGR